METSNNLMSAREVRLSYIPDSGILKRKKITSAKTHVFNYLNTITKIQ
jgi:hypothetical protein